MSLVIDPRSFLRSLYDAAVQRALPAKNIGAFLPPPPDPKKGRTVVLGAGKAGGAMAAAVDALWPANAPISGLVITRYEHIPPAYRAQPGRIEVVEAAHPVPDDAGRQATRRIAEMARGLTADDLVLCLISGGGSALLAMPAEGISFEDKQAINKALLKSGAAIDEMNCVRKHLSAIKGGRQAALCAPARVVTLLISDVPGDAPEVIASGPTVPDASTCAQALAICRRYGITLPPPRWRGWRAAPSKHPSRATRCSPATACSSSPRRSKAWKPPRRLLAQPAWRRTSSATKWKAKAARWARCMRRSLAPWRGAGSRLRGPA